jgi:flagellar FliL protein
MGDKKGNKGLMIILIITLVLVIGMAGFFGYFMFFKDKGASTTQKTTEKVEEKTVAMDEFIINLTDNNKYIKLNIALACTDAKVEEEIPTKIEQIRNEVNVYIRSKSSSDFDGIGLDKVKQELMEKIDSKLDSGKITNIYFHEIIIQ